MAKTLQELRDDYDANIAAQKSIVDAATNDDRDFTDEERSQLDAHEADLKEIQAALDRKEADRKRVERLAAAEQQANARPPLPPPAQPTRVEVLPQEERPNAGFKTGREFLMAVIDDGLGKRRDPRLHPLWQRGDGMQAAAGTDEQSEGAAGYGGFAVPTEFLPTMLQVQPEPDPVSSRVTMLPMGSNTLEILARTDKNHTSSVSGGITVTRRAETNSASDSRMEMERVTLNARKLTGLVYVTDELIQDSAISIPALIQQAMADEFTSKLLRERLTGTGVGEFTGVIGHVATVNQAAETGQAATTIVAENVIKMRSRCWGYGDAIWLANHDTIPQLFQLQIAVGTGGVPLYMPSVREDMPDVLLGRPIFFSEYTKTLGTSGDLVLGNWSQYVEGVRQTMDAAVSAHVRFVNSEQTFRFTMRNDAKPWWRSTLTPNQSTTTLSPFVTLATRS